MPSHPESFHSHQMAFARALQALTPSTPDALDTLDRFRMFVAFDPTAFNRERPAGHITGSAWILSPNLDQTLLTHHKKLGRWLQLGGHCDGDADVPGVALKEAHEESGLTNIRLVSDVPFDIDIHTIPSHKGVPAHVHFDAAYAFIADPAEPLQISSESHDLAWVSLNDPRVLQDPRLARMAAKTTPEWIGLRAAP